MTISRSERQLVLISAGTAARRDAMRAHAWRLMKDVNWEILAATLNRRKLLPVLGPRIREMAAGRDSDAFAAAVEESVAAAHPHAVFLMLVCDRVMSALAGAGIRSTPLKGPFLGERIYGDPGRRLSSDIDLLVDPTELDAAVAVVRNLDYGAPSDRVDASGLPLLHFALEHEHQLLPPVELHWRIHWYERSFARERLLPPECMSASEWRPAPADELVALLLFYARDGFVDLRLATDLSAWWDVFGAEVSAQAVADVLDVYPVLGRAVQVAARVVADVVGLPLEQVLGATTRTRLRDKFAARLANPNPRCSVSQQYADMGFIDGLLTPARDLGVFAQRQLLLPSEVLDEYAQNVPGFRAKTPLDYSLRVLARYGLSLLRLLRAPETLS